MNHVSCDRCGAAIRRPADGYKLTIAIRPGERSGGDATDDPVQAMADWLDELEESGECPAPGHRAEYDLCAPCRAHYAADPLGRNPGRGLRFSKN